MESYHQTYYQEHRDAMIERQLAYHRENREKNLARMRIYNKEYWRKKKMNLIEKMTPNTCKESKKKREKKEPKALKVARLPEEATELPPPGPVIPPLHNATEWKKVAQPKPQKVAQKPVCHRLAGSFVLSFD